MFIHAMHRWSEVITQSLWPHAFFIAVAVRNRRELDKNDLSPLDKISTSKHSINIHNSHSFEFPYFGFAAKS